MIPECSCRSGQKMQFSVGLTHLIFHRAEQVHRHPEQWPQLRHRHIYLDSILRLTFMVRKSPVVAT